VFAGQGVGPGISRSLVVGAQGPGVSAPVAGPLLQMVLLGGLAGLALGASPARLADRL